MARKRETWITSKEAAEILTANSGHTISDAYVRRLGLGDTPKLRSKAIDGRTKLYLKSDVEAYRVTERSKREEAVA